MATDHMQARDVKRQVLQDAVRDRRLVSARWSAEQFRPILHPLPHRHALDVSPVDLGPQHLHRDFVPCDVSRECAQTPTMCATHGNTGYRAAKGHNQDKKAVTAAKKGARQAPATTLANPVRFCRADATGDPMRKTRCARAPLAPSGQTTGKRSTHAWHEHVHHADCT